MFYCDPCAKKYEWPETLTISYGPCEMCDKTAACNEMPSRLLPEPRRRNETNEGTV